MNGGADARDSGRVRHRKLLAGEHFHSREHLDLAAFVHQKRAVFPVDHLDAIYGFNGFQQGRQGPFARQVIGQITHERIPPVSTKSIAPMFALLHADGVGEACKRARPV